MLLQQHGLLKVSFVVAVFQLMKRLSWGVPWRTPARCIGVNPSGTTTSCLVVISLLTGPRGLVMSCFLCLGWCSLAALMCSNSSVSSLDCTVMVNATFPHSLPLHVNVISNALLHRWSGNPVAVIQVIDSPLPRTLNEEVSLASAW